MRDWLQQVLSAYERNDSHSLGEMLDQAKSEAPPAYWAASGMILSRDGQLQNGMEAFLLALHADPASAPILLAEIQAVLAQYLVGHSQTAPLQTRLTRPHTSHHLEDQPSWQQLAHAYAHAGRGEEAFALVQEQVECQPDDPETYIFMAKIFGSRGLFKEALTALSFALGLAPYHSEALLVRGMLRQEMERYSEALADYLSVALLDSTTALAWEGLGEVILLAGLDQATALTAFEQALVLDPGRIGSRQGRARALHALGRSATAEQDLVENKEGSQQGSPPDSRTVIIEAWYRHVPGDSGHRCYMCGAQEAAYATDHYLDLEYTMGLALRKPGKTSVEDSMAAARRLHDMARARAVVEQSHGIRKRYATTFWCEGCMVNLIDGQMGHTGPGGMFLHSCAIAEPQGAHASAVLFRYLHTLDQNGLLFTREESVEGFLRSLAHPPDLVIDYTQTNPGAGSPAPQAQFSSRDTFRPPGKRKKRRRRGR